MTITEKTAYLKGLLEGLTLDETKPEGKLLKAVVETLDEMANDLSDLGGDVDAVVRAPVAKRLVIRELVDRKRRDLLPHERRDHEPRGDGLRVRLALHRGDKRWAFVPYRAYQGLV